MMMKALSVLLLLLSTVASAQTPVAGTERLAWSHDGVNVSRFELSVDAGPQTALVVTQTGLDYTAPLPALTPGTHTLSLTACNVAGCSAPLAIQVRVVVIPAVVTNLRIVSGV
jgi:hypothetical protein